MVIPSSIQKELRGKTLYIYSHIARLKKKKSRTHVAKYLSFNIDIFKKFICSRILANRQSAQRSRVRKLQYISELERSVTTLQVCT